MRLDAWADMQEQQAKQDKQAYRGPGEYPENFDPRYDPDQDAMYDIAWKPDYHADLQVASQDYWASQTGSLTPPLPSYRTDDRWWHKNSTGPERRLGREMDVYGCQAMMRSARHQYQSRLYASIIGAIISLGSLAAAGAGGIAVAIVLILLLVPPLALAVRRHYNGIYRRYYYAQEKILKTGQPVWVPFSRGDLRRIRSTQGPIWP